VNQRLTAICGAEGANPIIII